MSVEDVKLQAWKEIVDENFRKAVELKKEKMRKQKPWWKLFPWVIIIKRRDS